MKRKIAAALCAVMMSSCLPLGAMAAGFDRGGRRPGSGRENGFDRHGLRATATPTPTPTPTPTLQKNGGDSLIERITPKPESGSESNRGNRGDRFPNPGFGRPGGWPAPTAEPTPEPQGNGGSSLIERITPKPEGGSGLIERITPKPEGGNGLIELITPKPEGGSGLIELITPKPEGGSGLIERITPKPEGGSEGNWGGWFPNPGFGGPGSWPMPTETPKPEGGSDQNVKAFTILPVVHENSIGVVVDGASKREVEVVLLDRHGKQAAAGSIIGSGIVQLGRFATGTYTVRAQYVTPVKDEYGKYDHMTVTAKAIVPKGYEDDHRPEKPVNIEAAVETGTNYIIVTVKRAAKANLIVSVSGQKNKHVFEGGVVRFDGLIPGKRYDVEVRYTDIMMGGWPWHTSVTLPLEKDYPSYERGDRGNEGIYDLQQRLKDLGYYTIKVDGIYGSGTQRAVREFQRVNGLKVTGKADSATQKLLYSSAAKPADSSVYGDYETLSRSAKYKSAVVSLQRRLKTLGYYSGSIDGYFGSATYRAVRNFQSRNGIRVTGVADPYTQQVLYSSSAKFASGSSSSSSSTGYRLLYWGCRGDAVVRLQQALINAGYKSIVRTADGIFGQWTYDAVRAYQKDHGLAVDGIAGKNTQNSLYGTSY